MWNYTNAVHEHFLRPHNAGPMEDANAISEVGSLACGDALKLYLKINDEGIIEKASFETFGCASAIASSSVLTDMVKGMKAEDVIDRMEGTLCGFRNTSCPDQIAKNLKKALAEMD